MSSQQSKDNTCPNCDGSGVQPGDMYSKCVTWCVTCHGSGQQEDKPTAPLKASHTQECWDAGIPDCICKPTDSKPEQPTIAEIRDTADKMYGPLAKELSKTSAVIEPSKPDQLREQLIKLGVKGDRQLPGVLALLATEYDRGVQDGYKQGLEQNTAYFNQRKAEYDRGKVDERKDCLTVAQWWIENDGRPKHLLQDLEEPDKSTLDHIPELKSKGESK